MMDIDGKEEISELRANIDDAKNDIIPWRTLVSIAKIYSSTLERSNQLNSILLDEFKGYKERENDSKKLKPSKMDIDGTEDEISELRANIDDAKNDIIPWRTLVSITKIYSSTLERSNQLNSILLDELKGYKERENELKKENQRLKEITPIAKEIVESKIVEEAPLEKPDLDLEITMEDEPLETLENDPMETDSLEKMENNRLEKLINLPLEKLAKNPLEDEVIDMTLDEDNGSFDKSK